jgi:uncharacterized Fe-S cluster protein YjdI
MEAVKEYSSDDITIVWKPKLCIHSTLCWKGLIEVFNPDKKPWINPMGANTEKIIAQVNKCPSGALSYYNNNEKPKENKAENSEIIVEIVKDGPLIIHGNILLKDPDGKITKKQNICALCRCGASKNKPYCDGSHIDAKFKG